LGSKIAQLLIKLLNSLIKSLKKNVLPSLVRSRGTLLIAAIDGGIVTTGKQKAINNKLRPIDLQKCLYDINKNLLIPFMTDGLLHIYAYSYNYKTVL
jgi:hypothetical protein